MKKGFTLAEVLITLAIIGVVAAMTIPTLISNYQKQQYVVGIQRNISVLTNAFKLMLANEQVDTIVQSKFPTVHSSATAEEISMQDMLEGFEYLSKFIKIDNMCYGETEDSCSAYKNDYYFLDPNMESLGPMVGVPYFQLNDGTIVYCAPAAVSDTDKDTPTHILYVDVNGENPPNRFGRDVHFFYLTNYGKLWFGQDNLTGPVPNWKEEPSFCGSPNSSDFTGVEGTYCVLRIYSEGWKMTY